MAERREKLDFDTVPMTVKGTRGAVKEILEAPDWRVLERSVLSRFGLGVSPKEAEEAVAKFPADQRTKLLAEENQRRAAQKQAPLDAAQAAALIAAVAVLPVEKAKVLAALNKTSGFKNALTAATEDARKAKEAAQGNLVIPTDLPEWEPSKPTIQLHKDLVALLKNLRTIYPAGFRTMSRTDHWSGGSFAGRYRSVDLMPNEPGPGEPKRIPEVFHGARVGYYPQAIAYTFALAIDKACTGKGTFQILYNDYLVAREANKVMGNGTMTNVDNVCQGSLNWHGPLITHFHVDFAI